jgi:hypothetical protein
MHRGFYAMTGRVGHSQAQFAAIALAENRHGAKEKKRGKFLNQEIGLFGLALLSEMTNTSRKTNLVFPRRATLNRGSKPLPSERPWVCEDRGYRVGHSSQLLQGKAHSRSLRFGRDDKL